METPLWGGLLVTLVLSFVGIAVSLPLGIVLALGRRSKLPVIKTLSIIFIEMVRGVPLVTVLIHGKRHAAAVPAAGRDLRQAVTCPDRRGAFASAYMAEVVRGGLQAIPRGQYEGADALGLSYWQKTGLVVLPQALKLVIPGIVNTFIGLFKDTSLVYIIGMFDLLGIVQAELFRCKLGFSTDTRHGFDLCGFRFLIFCFAMSRYSIFMERRLDTGHKR
ncbi:amino acid ABC transporter permease [Brucella abortus]|nr:amino acid ABC transporter permease [Brucella abortus]